MLLCLSSLTEEKIRLLFFLQPGQDGGVPKARHTRAGYDKEGFANANVEHKVRAILICMRLFEIKTDFGNCEREYGAFLENTRKTLMESGDLNGNYEVAALLPNSFKAMLTMLDDKEVLEGVRGEGQFAASSHALWNIIIAPGRQLSRVQTLSSGQTLYPKVQSGREISQNINL